ncbi:MAG: c-type cytochrome [Candidatus Neomarinimicrobiota bacterium]
MKKLLLLLAGFLLTLQGALTAQELQNVQVLPFEAKKDIVEFMKNTVAKSLGVKCTFCHNLKDYPSDENPHKVVAREMIRMTLGINERLVGIQKVAKKAGMKHWEEAPKIECWVCHRGGKEIEYAAPK